MNDDKSTLYPTSIGLDIENTERFRKNISDDFIKRTFSDTEIEYCEKQSDPAQHFCARFAAKEAAVKALSQLGIKVVVSKNISISNNEDGLPLLKINDKIIKEEYLELFSELIFKVSLTHTKEIGAAIVLIIKKL
ncbi:MAG: holo-[acyl-carrier-protein] synthase [Asgard group archaeon]|nr:holo-[acyl-carrier-protein] synthase [Asgard group archaeon]